MPWINTISYENASGKLRLLYDRVKGPGNNIDNIMMMHSLRPHTMEGHMAIYKSVLHHTRNTLPKWYLETIGVWVSSLNHCDYCVEHHFAGLTRLLDDDQRAGALRAAIEARNIDAAPLDETQKLGLIYAEQGNTEKALSVINELTKFGGADGIESLKGIIHLYLGSSKKGFDTINKGILNQNSYIYLKVDPKLDRYRNEAKFKELLKLYNLG